MFQTTENMSKNIEFTSLINKKVNLDLVDGDTINKSVLNDLQKTGKVEVYAEKGILKYIADINSTIEKSNDSNREEIASNLKKEIAAMYKHRIDGEIVYIKPIIQPIIEKSEIAEPITFKLTYGAEETFEKGNIAESFRWGDNAKMTFEKKGSDLKKIVTAKIDSLQAECTDIYAKMVEIYNACAVKPTSPVSDYMFNGMKDKFPNAHELTRYSWDQISPDDNPNNFSSVTKPTEQEAKIYRFYNDLVDGYMSRWHDILTLKTLDAVLEDNKTFTLTLRQLMDLGVDSSIEKGEEDEFGGFDPDIEKAIPIGTVNKYGKIKTAEGWVYQKGAKKSGGAAPVKEESAPAKKKEEGAESSGENEKDLGFDHKDFLNHPFPGRTADEHKIMHKMNKLVSEGKLIKTEKVSGPTTYTIYKEVPKEEENTKPEKKEKNNSGYTNTAKIPFGDKEPKIGIGGDRSKMVDWPETNKLNTSAGQKEADIALSQMSAQGRLQALERYGKALSDDRGRGKLHRKISNHDSIAKFLDEARDKYIGDTKIKQDGIEIEIDKRGNTTINGKKVYVDKNSNYVKLGSPGRSSSTGGMYSGGHFDGQLQGTNYVHAFSEIVGRLKGGESIKDVVAGANRGTDSYKSDYKDTIKHLGLDSTGKK